MFSCSGTTQVNYDAPRQKNVDILFFRANITNLSANPVQVDSFEIESAMLALDALGISENASSNSEISRENRHQNSFFLKDNILIQSVKVLLNHRAVKYNHLRLLLSLMRHSITIKQYTTDTSTWNRSLTLKGVNE